MDIYAIHDHDVELKKKGAFKIAKEKVQEFNDKEFGIFFTANDFKGRRKAENLVKINYWLADIDSGTKPEQMERIQKLPLKPTIIVETKNGYHCYWKSKDATLENYREIAKGLIKRLNADRACKDVCRLLRLPNFMHCKNPKDKFKIKVVSKNDKSFAEELMLLAYKLPKPVIKKLNYTGEKGDLIKEENWEKIFKLSSIGNGGRNNDFSRIRLWLRDEGFSSDVIFNTIARMNQKISQPLDNWEIKLLCRVK